MSGVEFMDFSSIISSITTFDYASLLPFVGIVVLSFVVAKVVYFLIDKVARRLVGQTKTILDDLILDAIEGPITYGIVIIGLYAGASMSSLSAIPIVVGVFKILLMIWVAVAAYRIICAFIHWYVVEIAPRHKLSLHDSEPTMKRIVALVLLVLFSIMILDSTGVEVAPLIASLGIAGLAVALALQDTLGNFFGGVSISVDKPLRQGDFIELTDLKEKGYVEKIGWRSTQVRTLANNIILVPNSKLAQSTIINYHMPMKEMSIVIPVSVSYDSDLEKVEKTVISVADRIQRTVGGAVPAFKPFIRYNSFDDSGIKFSVILRVMEFTDQYLVTHEFVKALHARFKQEGIEIPYPKRSVYIEHMPDGFGAKPKAKKAK